jgi:simple sugar transport system substrate-binding protein
MAYWAENYLKSVGRGEEDVNVVVLEGTTGSDAATGRTNGINEVLAKFPHLKLVASQTGNFTRSEGQAVMESLLKSQSKIDVLLAQNDDMGLGAVDAIKAAGLVPGKDIIIVGCDSPIAAFDAILAGDVNATIECTPLYGPFIKELIDALEAGEEISKTVIHPEEGAFDTNGGIAYTEAGDKLTEKAADVYADRKY